jgi:glycosyltransferase involved in cell wall biosynthesis
MLQVREKLLVHCDEALLLPSQYYSSNGHRLRYKISGYIYTLSTGLKFSNYLVDQIEFTPQRISTIVNSRNFDCALFEYWHAIRSVSFLQAKGIPCILDMHNILWRSYEKQMKVKRGVPEWWKRWALDRYKSQEEHAWKQFDSIIPINAEEDKHVRGLISSNIPVFYTPMGIDLRFWPYSWQPATPPRVGYYGGLANPDRQRDALRCYHSIMPEIWNSYANAELWLVGSNPPPALVALQSDHRVKVTGYVERVQDVLKTMSVVLCPFTGTYGFRSRVVEVMALGVPIVASSDAVYGMEMQDGRGLFLEETDLKMAQVCRKLIEDPVYAQEHSRGARGQIDDKYSFEATYGKLARNIFEFCRAAIH